MATFQVPVWFNIEAKDSEDALRGITDIMNQCRAKIYMDEPRIDNWAVEEPVLIEDIQEN